MLVCITFVATMKDTVLFEYVEFSRDLFIHKHRAQETFSDIRMDHNQLRFRFHMVVKKIFFV